MRARTSSRPTRTIIRDLKAAGRRRPPRDLRAQLSALLADRPAADLQGDPVLVREGHRLPRPHGRAQPGHHLGARARQGRHLRQLARRTRATGTSAATASGARRSRCGSRTTRNIRGSTVYGSLDEIERDFGVRPKDLHRPVCRRPDSAEPRRPDRQVDDAPGRGRARLLVRVGLDAVLPGPLPVREQGVVRQPLPRRLHRRICRPDPRLVLHADGDVDGAVRQGAVPELHLPRRRPRREQAEAVQAAEELSGPGRGLQHLRRRRAPLVHDLVAAPRRAATSPCRRTAAPSATPCARCCCRSGTPIRSSRSTPISTASRAGWSRRPRPSSTATSSARRPSWCARVEAAMDRLDIAAACNALPPFIEALNNWYIRRSRDRFWKSEKDADKRAAYDTLYTVLVTHDADDGAVPAVSDRAHPPCAGRRRERPPPGLAGRVGLRRRSRRWSSAWTSPAPSARPRPRSAPRRIFATACRSAGSPSPIRSHAHARAAPRRHRRRGQRQGSGLRRRSRRVRHRGAGRSTRASSASASAAAMKDVLAAAKAGAVEPRRRRCGRGGRPRDPSRASTSSASRPPKASTPSASTARPASSSSTRRSTPSSSARASPATSSASSRWRARTPASTSPTASAIEVKAGPAANDAIAAHLDAVKHETLAVAFGRTEATPKGFVVRGQARRRADRDRGEPRGVSVIRRHLRPVPGGVSRPVGQGDHRCISPARNLPSGSRPWRRRSALRAALPRRKPTRAATRPRRSAKGRTTYFFKNSSMEFVFLIGLGRAYYQGEQYRQDALAVEAGEGRRFRRRLPGLQGGG